MPQTRRPSEFVRLKEHVEVLIAGVYRAIESLRVVTDVRFLSLEKASETANKVIEKAVEVANKAMESRLALLNEFRGAMDDLVQKLVTKVEFLAFKDRVEADIKEMRESMSRFMSRSEIEDFKTRTESDIESLRLSKANLEGKASQSSVTITLIIAIAGLIIGALGIILR